MEVSRNSTARRLLWGLYIMGCKMSSTYHGAHGVENPGYVPLSNARTSFKSVEGALTVNDALALQAFAEELCLGKEESGALRYAEVGSYLGLSTQIVAHACPRALIFAHDLFPVNDGSSEYVLPRGEENENDEEFSHPPPAAKDFLVEFWAGVHRNHLEGRVVPMRGPSSETLPVHSLESLDMVFVDGDHSFKGALADLRGAWPLIKPGGILVIHDAVTLDDGRTPHPVRLAVITFSAEQSIPFFDVEGTWGVAVMRRSANQAVAGETSGSASGMFGSSEIYPTQRHGVR